jgi:hypothetical protein
MQVARVLVAATLVFCVAFASSAQVRPGTPRTNPAAARPFGARPAALSIIRGDAVASDGGPLRQAAIRLRDIRLGHIAGSSESDKDGLFEFRGIEPGNYVAEIIGSDQTVLAASPIVTVDAGQTATTTVRLPVGIPVGGALAHTASTAAIVISAAGASSLLAIRATTSTSPTSSPR